MAIINFACHTTGGCSRISSQESISTGELCINPKVWRLRTFRIVTRLGEHSSSAWSHPNTKSSSYSEVDVCTSGLIPRVRCLQETQEHLSEATALKGALAAAQQRVSGALWSPKLSFDARRDFFIDFRYQTRRLTFRVRGRKWLRDLRSNLALFVSSIWGSPEYHSFLEILTTWTTAAEAATEQSELMRKKDAERLQAQTQKTIEESQAAATAKVDFGTFKVSTPYTCTYHHMTSVVVFVLIAVCSMVSMDFAWL